MAIRFNEASAARTDSAKASTAASTLVNIDVGAFLQWLSAYADEVRAGGSPVVSDGVFVPDPQKLSGFVALRFRPEFKVAFDAWIATRPLAPTSSAGPSTPFDLPQYQLAAQDNVKELEARAEELARQAREANQRGDNYILMTVLFTLSLFFAGISTKIDNPRMRRLVLGLSSVVLVSAAVVVATFPVRL